MSFKTAIIGFGQIAAGNAVDPVMGRAFRYAAHAQVLRDHPSFAWEAVVDPDPKARERAKRDWGIPMVFASVEELRSAWAPELVVLATPPGGRAQILEGLPSVKGALVEKPLGRNENEVESLSRLCESRALPVQVNFWRRADRTFRRLAAGWLQELIGIPQAAFALYGNGLRNNGSHMVDFVRMLLGEVASAHPLEGEVARPVGPLAGDIQFAFALRLESGVTVTFQPLNFEHYRENGLDIWGTEGRLSILQDCRLILHQPTRPNRGLADAREVASEAPEVLEATFGEALYEMYENWAAALAGKAELFSPLDSAVRSESIIDALTASVERDRVPARAVL